MPLSLPRSHALVLAGLTAVAIIGIVLAVVVDASAGVAVLLLLQPAVFAALIVVRRQITRAQRQIRSDANIAISGELARLQSAVDEISSSAPVKQLLEALGRERLATTDCVAQLRAMRERFDQLARDTELSFLRVTADAWALHNLVGLIDVSIPLPAPGGWAVTPGTLVELVTLVRENPRDLLVVECGSGVSTVWLAYCQQIKGGHGRVIALEHDPSFAAKTKAELRRLGLDERAEVRHAPLVDIDVNGHSSLWYDPRALAGLTEVDLLFVDGPPWRMADDARYPAMMMFAPILARDARVILDDVDREPEQSIAERWSNEEAAGIRFVPERCTDRAQVFLVQPVSCGLQEDGANDGLSDRPYDATHAKPI